MKSKKSKLTNSSSYIDLSVNKLYEACLMCSVDLTESQLYRRLRVCPKCNFHYNISTRRYLAMLVDSNSFRKFNFKISTPKLDVSNNQTWEEYKKRINRVQKLTREPEGIISGKASLDGLPAILLAISYRFMGGNLGNSYSTIVTQTFKKAKATKLPIILIFSGTSTRQQEGLIAWLHNAKIALAVDDFLKGNSGFFVFLTNPSNGITTSPLASRADFLLAENGTSFGYAPVGSIKDGFDNQIRDEEYSAEKLLNYGQLDAVMSRSEVRTYISKLLNLTHAGKVIKQVSKVSINLDNLGLSDHQVNAELNFSAHEYLNELASDFIELKGDRINSEDMAVRAGLARYEGITITALVLDSVAHHEKGITAGGFRKIARILKISERLKIPVICFLGNLNVNISLINEREGVLHAISELQKTLLGLKVPFITLIIDNITAEFGSFMLIGDHNMMLTNKHIELQVYSGVQLFSAKECVKLEIVQQLINYPQGSVDNIRSIANLIQLLLNLQLERLTKLSAKNLLKERHNRLLSSGMSSSFLNSIMSTTLINLGEKLKLSGKAFLKTGSDESSETTTVDDQVDEDLKDVLIP